MVVEQELVTNQLVHPEAAHLLPQQETARETAMKVAAVIVVQEKPTTESIVEVALEAVHLRFEPKTSVPIVVLVQETTELPHENHHANNNEWITML